MMTGARRNMMLSIIDDKPQLVTVMHQLTRYKDCDKFLKWLNANRLTGENLIDWMKINFNNSTIGMVKFIIMHYNKNNEQKPIIVGKDWN